MERARLVATDPTDRPREFTLSNSDVAVGSDRANDIVLTGAGISRRHAVLRLRDGRYFLDDLDSSNGSFVNGNRVHGPTALSDGDRVRFAGAAFVFRDPRALAGKRRRSASRTVASLLLMFRGRFRDRGGLAESRLAAPNDRARGAGVKSGGIGDGPRGRRRARGQSGWVAGRGSPELARAERGGNAGTSMARADELLSRDGRPAGGQRRSAPEQGRLQPCPLHGQEQRAAQRERARRRPGQSVVHARGTRSRARRRPDTAVQRLPGALRRRRDRSLDGRAVPSDPASEPGAADTWVSASSTRTRAMPMG